MARGGTGERSDDYYLQRMFEAFRLARWALLLLAIPALYIPIHATIPIARELAGKDTELTASFSISILISIGSLAGVITTVFKSRGRKGELERLRGKVEVYERQDGIEEGVR